MKSHHFTLMKIDTLWYKTENHSKYLLGLSMVIGYLLWFYFANLLLFRGRWVGGWVGELEDKVHLSPAEAEIGAEFGNIIFFNDYISLNIKSIFDTEWKELRRCSTFFGFPMLG